MLIVYCIHYATMSNFGFLFVFLFCFVCDQLRFDALNFVQNSLPDYEGKVKIRTPNINELAESGVWFQTAYCVRTRARAEIYWIGALLLVRYSHALTLSTHPFPLSCRPRRVARRRGRVCGRGIRYSARQSKGTK